jgi:hypothetical protein
VFVEMTSRWISAVTKKTWRVWFQFLFLAKVALKSLLPNRLETMMSLANLRGALGPGWPFFSPLSIATRVRYLFKEDMFPFYMQTSLLKILF